MMRLRTLDELDDALDGPRAIYYKHSPVCGLSLLARRQVARFRDNFPDSTVYLVDVVADRPLSDRLERHLGVRHESPQAILVERGRAVTHASHRSVRAATLGEWWTGTERTD